ncbi:MAG: AAA family ATPase [Nocardioidaceae bacterium]
MLIGRTVELERIETMLAGARAGTSSALAVVGEPGIGKTALLDAAQDQAPDFTVLRTRGVQSESGLACSSLLEILQPLRGLLPALPAPLRSALAPALGLTDSVADSFALAAAATTLLVSAAECRPVLVLADDLQWIDPVSARAITFAARRLHGISAAFLIATRDVTPSLDRVEGIDRLHLDPLEEAAATALLVDAGLGGSTLTTIRRTAAGNPLALVELARERSAPRTSGSVAERLFAERLESLPEDCRLALLATALDTTGDPSVVAAVVGEKAIRQLAERGLVILTGSRLDIRHPLLRSLVLDRSWHDEHRRTHAALAAVLPPGDTRTRHRALAAVGSDEELAAELQALGVRSPDPSAAAWALERAALLSDPGLLQSRRWVGAARASFDARNVADTRRLLDRAREGVAPGIAVEIDEIDGRLMVAEGALIEGATVLSRVAELRSGSDPAAAARLLVEAATALSTASRPQDAMRVVERARALVDGVDPVLALLVEAARAEAVAVGGDYMVAYRALRSAGEIADGAPSVHDDPRARLCLVESLFSGGHYERSRELANAVIRRTRHDGALGELRYALALLFSIELVCGRVDRMRIAATEELELAAGFGLLMEHEEALGHVAWCDALAGDVDECRRHVQQRFDLSVRVGPDPLPHPALGLLHLALSDPKAAVPLFQATLRTHEQRGLAMAGVLAPVAGDLVEALLRAGHASAARDLLGAFEMDARRLDRPHALSLVHRCRGLLADPDRFDGEFQRSLAYDEDDPWPLERARTLLCWGERLRRTRRRAEASIRLDEALAEFSRLGADVWVDRARTEMGAAGRRTGGGPMDQAALTRQERLVAAMVAEGATNRDVAARLFVSVNTVETHLRHIFAKAGVRSRTELARKFTGFRDPREDAVP